MRRVPRVWALALAATGAGGCETAVGRYFVDRARDLGECVRVQTGVAYGLGGGVHAAGLVHLGLGGGYLDHRFGIGWVYGRGYAVGLGDGGVDLELFALTHHIDACGRDWTSNHGFPLPADVLYKHRCGVLVPALWDPPSGPPNAPTPAGLGELWADARWTRVHALDLEVGVYVGLVGARIGVSPGEIADFLLGWFGLDIAGDDGPSPAPPVVPDRPTTHAFSEAR